MKNNSPQYLNILCHDTYQKERKQGVITFKKHLARKKWGMKINKTDMVGLM